MKCLWLFPVLSCVLLFFSGCNTQPLLLQWDPPPESVKIAVLLPLTGPHKNEGAQMLEGATFAARELNRRQGVSGRPVKLIVEDIYPGAEQAVKRALARGAVAAIIGYYTTEVSALWPLCAQAMLPTVIPVATEDSHEGASPWLFRNAYTNRQQSEILAGYLWYWQKLLRIGLLVDTSPENLAYSRSITRNTSQYFRDLGGQVVCTRELAGTEKEQESQLRDMLTFGPQAIVLSSGPQDSARLLKKLRSMGYRGIICGSDMWDSYEFLQELGSFEPGVCYFTAFFSEENLSFESKEFREKFRKEFFHDPGSAETQTYDAVKMLAAGLWKADTLEKFRRNWLSIKNSQGAAGTYTMLKNGGVDRTVYIVSLGVDRNGVKPRPYFRLTHKLMYSKMDTYRND